MPIVSGAAILALDLLQQLPLIAAVVTMAHDMPLSAPGIPH